MARIFRVAALLLLLAVSAAQAQDVRLSPYPIAAEDVFIDVGNAINHIPSIGQVSNIQDYTVDAGESTHQCRTSGASAGSHSVWFTLQFAGGTLIIDTQGSNYNTLVSVYNPAGTFAGLTAVACNDDDVPGSDDTARVSAVLPAGIYYVQISRFETVATAAALNLQLSISAVYSGTAPKGDNFANAKPIKFNKAVTIRNAQYATEEALEPDRDCGSVRPSGSLWFKLTVPAEVANAGGVRFNVTTDGSVFDYGRFQNTDTVVELFSGATLATLTSHACSDDAYSPIGALMGVNMPPSQTTAYIRVTTYGGDNPVGASQVKVKVTIGQYAYLSTDLSFEEVPTTDWVLSKASGDGQVCGLNLDTNDDCVFRFVGGPNEKSTLKQTFTVPAGVKIRKDQQIAFVYILKASDPATKAVLKATIAYTDGTPTTVVKRKLNGSVAPDFVTLANLVYPASSKVGLMTIKIKNKSTAGTWDLNASGSYIFGTIARGAAGMPDGVLPLPASPQ